MGDKCALPSDLTSGMRYKTFLTRVMALLAGGAMPLAFAPVGWAWIAVMALAAFPRLSRTVERTYHPMLSPPKPRSTL